jgi:exopolyphosphatase/guanosine-5'-triphosphate,3'-diphosphate pyrophosphatase
VERFAAISVPKLAETVECVAGFVDDARNAGAELIEVVVASPGRQARNSAQLMHLLSRATEIEARVLTREDEARLAFEGALADVTPRGAVAVCDVGGGSAQVAVGTVEHGPAWLRSIDLGSLRLSARIPYGDPPGKKELAVLRGEARAAVSALTPPLPGGAVAVGGTARSLRKLVGPVLGPAELREAFDLLRGTPTAELAGRYGIDLWRARALPAGTAIVAALQTLLGVPLDVGRGGLREGVLLELFERLPLPAAQSV